MFPECKETIKSGLMEGMECKGNLVPVKILNIGSYEIIWKCTLCGRRVQA